MSGSDNNTAVPRNARTQRKPRTVSSLTSQQIQYKRDLDRKAQRALRQRVKSRVRDLEQDLARAKSSSSDRERSMMDEAQSLREGNRRLRLCLESIGQFALSGVAVEDDNGNGQSPDSVPNAEDEPVDASARIELPSPPSESLTGQSITQPAQRNHYLDGTITSQRVQDPIMAPTPTSSIAVNTVLHPPTSSGIASVLPKHLSAICPLDQILLDFISSQRALAAKGFAMNAIVGPNQPCLQTVLNPLAAAGVHPTSLVLAEVLSTFWHVALPEKLAFMFVMFRTMRWQISPTDTNYEEMPRWLRSTAVQITIAHAAWIDNIPWPRVRDMLIENPEKYPFPVFSELYSQNVTVNWPYDTMHTVSRQGGPIFEKHVRKLDNWTVSSHFKDYMPEMTGAIYGRD